MQENDKNIVEVFKKPENLKKVYMVSDERVMVYLYLFKLFGSFIFNLVQRLRGKRIIKFSYIKTKQKLQF